MINIRRAKKYCCEDISKIENYDKAIADETQTWQCHHRAEILPCGRFSRKDLDKHDLLFKQPAERLVFLTEYEHKSLHKNHLGYKHSIDTKNKISLAKKGKTSNRKGKKMSIESREKLKKSLTGRKLSFSHIQKLKNKIWANNGVVSKMFDQNCVPAGWSLGRISWKKEISL